MENPRSENSTLLHSGRNSVTRIGYSFPKIRCCVESKAALLILLWNFAVLVGYIGFYDMKAMIQVSHSSLIIITFNSFLTVFTIFSPVAGLLTDIRFSRYKAILCSSYVIIAHTTTLPLILFTALLSNISLDIKNIQGKICYFLYSRLHRNICCSLYGVHC